MSDINTNIDQYRYDNNASQIYTSMSLKIDAHGNVDFGGELIKSYTYLGNLNRYLDNDLIGLLLNAENKSNNIQIVNKSVNYNYDTNVINASLTTSQDGVLQYTLNRIYPNHKKSDFKTTVEDIYAIMDIRKKR